MSGTAMIAVGLTWAFMVTAPAIGGAGDLPPAAYEREEPGDAAGIDPIDLVDFGAFQWCFERTDVEVCLDRFDVDANQRIDLDDFAAFSRHHAGADCATRIRLSCGDEVSVDNSSALSRPDMPRGSCWIGQSAGTVFLELLAGDTSARIRTDTLVTPPAEDSELVVFSADQNDVCDVSAWTQWACSEDEGIGLNGDLCVRELMVGRRYIILLAAASAGDRGVYTVSAQCPCP